MESVGTSTYGMDVAIEGRLELTPSTFDAVTAAESDPVETVGTDAIAIGFVVKVGDATATSEDGIAAGGVATLDKPNGGAGILEDGAATDGMETPGKLNSLLANDGSTPFVEMPGTEVGNSDDWIGLKELVLTLMASFDSQTEH